jgi:hypothetical protein
MPERLAALLHRRAPWASLRRLPLVAVFVLAYGAAACTETIEGGAACPSLCPSRSTEFLDTIVDAVVLDTSIAGFPSGGLNGLLLLANRGDTVQTSAVIRYDQIARTFRPNNTGDTVAIAQLDSAWIRVALDTTGNRGTQPVRIDAFDIDTTASDSVTSVVQSLFREDRLLGSVTIVPSTVGDSLRIPLDAQKVLNKIRNGARMRVGLRMASQGQIRIVAFALGSGAALLAFDPGGSGDTLKTPVTTLPFTLLQNSTQEQQLAYSVYAIVDQASPGAAAGLLQVGGYPSARTYLRFDVPRKFIDSSTIVRAELLVTQVATPHSRTTDSLFVEALIPTSSDVVTDVRRILDFTVTSAFVGIDSTRFKPAESGVKSINVLGIVRNWRLLPATVPRAIGLRVAQEGADAIDVRFYSIEGAPSATQRPRLRITYLPRAEFALP